jgi:hypothetical protein
MMARQLGPFDFGAGLDISFESFCAVPTQFRTALLDPHCSKSLYMSTYNNVYTAASSLPGEWVNPYSLLDLSDWIAFFVDLFRELADRIVLPAPFNNLTADILSHTDQADRFNLYTCCKAYAAVPFRQAMRRSSNLLRFSWLSRHMKAISDEGILVSVLQIVRLSESAALTGHFQPLGSDMFSYASRPALLQLGEVIPDATVESENPPAPAATVDLARPIHTLDEIGEIATQPAKRQRRSSE